MRQRFLAQTTLKMATHFTMKYIEGHQSLANINENNTYSQFAAPADYSNTSSQHTLREFWSIVWKIVCVSTSGLKLPRRNAIASKNSQITQKSKY